RTAVTTAANCCRNISHDSFPVIRDVMPILLNVLSSHDQKVVEQGSLCVTRVIDSFKHSPDKLEQLVDAPLLRAVLGLLLPGTTNLIGANIHTEFLRVLAIVARASPSLSAELLKMNVVDTLYQILTGVSPPSETADAASKIDSVVIMQALIHRPREQVFETLNVICELLPLPKIDGDSEFDVYDEMEDDLSNDGDAMKKTSKTEERLKLLEDCKQETRRFAMILLPTLTDAYSSTVNLSVRQKVLIAQLKILSNLETSVIEEALRPVPYASFLASILSQEDHPSLVMFALQASVLLFERLEYIYQYQFHREGVIGEIKKLAGRPLEHDRKPSQSSTVERDGDIGEKSETLDGPQKAEDRSKHDYEADDDDEVDDDEDEDIDEEQDEDEMAARQAHNKYDSESSDSSDDELPSPLTISGLSDLVIMRAKNFLEKYDTAKGKEMKEKASKIREDLHKLADNIEAYYRQSHPIESSNQLFTRLASYFDGDALESITSSELLDSGIIRVLVQVLSADPSTTYSTARPHFVSAFMESLTQAKIKKTTASSSATPFTVLIQKLQDLLSRAEHFEVLTVNNNASESSRSSSTSMLSRQLRLRLSADGDSDIPLTYREMIVSIHAIATFKALDDYLRPRFSTSDRPASAQRRRDMLQQLANARLAQLSGAAESGLMSPFGQELASPITPATPGASRSVWSGVHTIKFRKIRGAPPSTSNDSPPTETEKPGSSEALPASLDGHPVTSSILALLRILHELNANLDEIEEIIGRVGTKPYKEPLASFINTKLTAKMNRQLEEPLIVASNCLPDWSEDLARSFPFLFPFETRHLFLQSTSFGYSRSMIRWQNSQSENDDRRDRRRDDRPILGRPQRQKVRISRHRILESAMKVMDMYGGSPSVLEVEYFEEVGTGLGPTLEFYSTVSKEFCKKKLKMWRENDSSGTDQFAFGKTGLFPAPMSEADVHTDAGKKLLLLFKTLGKFVARSMLDSRIIDISFSPTFFKVGGISSVLPSIGLLRTVDQDLANSLSQLQQFVKAQAKIELDSSLTKLEKVEAIEDLTIRGAKIEDLMLDFTLPGYPGIELVENGANVNVNMENVQKYIDQVLDVSLGRGVRSQVEAFQVGFSQVFSYTTLKAFTPDELVMLFGRVEEDWSIETLMDSVKADHGFNMDSKSVKNLLQTMSELKPPQRRDFLQFVTGSPKLPIGGFKSLTPMFTVVCKPSEPPYSSDDYLPSVMTCVNYLKLPDYSSQAVLKQKLFVAIREGQGAFHLS
ncbi:Ubiquitin fusion degradation protein 4, partial [Exophiala xenobiotica]